MKGILVIVCRFHLCKAFFFFLTSVLVLLTPTLSHPCHGQGGPEKLSDRLGVLQPFQSRAGAGSLGLGTLVVLSPRLCPSTLAHLSPSGGVRYPDACLLAHPLPRMGFGGGCPHEASFFRLEGGITWCQSPPPPHGSPGGPNLSVFLLLPARSQEAGDKNLRKW